MHNLIKTYHKSIKTNVKNKVKTIIYDNIIKKTVYPNNSKKNNKILHLNIKNNCNIVTNLMDAEQYSKNKILELYRSRWNIEVFFKYIKGHFKFQDLTEKSIIKNKKMYVCELIIIYISKIIEKYYLAKFPSKIKSTNDNIYCKINGSNLIEGIFSILLNKLINNKLNSQKMDKFCDIYIKIIYNKKDRTFCRVSKTPFKKWYIKGYSEQTKYFRICNAIINNTINDLNKNVKTIAKKVEAIFDNKNIKIYPKEK